MCVPAIIYTTVHHVVVSVAISVAIAVTVSSLLIFLSRRVVKPKKKLQDNTTSTTTRISNKREAGSYFRYLNANDNNDIVLFYNMFISDFSHRALEVDEVLSIHTSLFYVVSAAPSMWMWNWNHLSMALHNYEQSDKQTLRVGGLCGWQVHQRRRLPLNQF